MSTEFISNKYSTEHVSLAETSENAYVPRNIYSSYFTSCFKGKINPLSIYLSFLVSLDLHKKTTKVAFIKANGSVNNIPGLQ